MYPVLIAMAGSDGVAPRNARPLEQWDECTGLGVSRLGEQGKVAVSPERV